MELFSSNKDVNESVGELILEAFLNSSIQTIKHLNLSWNESWFNHGDTKEEREGIVEMLTEIISMQTECPNVLNLGRNRFSSSGTEKLMTTIAARVALASYALHEIHLSFANFESDESVKKLAEILSVTPCFKKCDIAEQ